MTSNHLISLKRAAVNLSARPILNDISLDINSGQCWWIKGDNGSGKSTLLNLLAANVMPSRRDQGMRQYYFNGAPQQLLNGIKKHIGYASDAMQTPYRQGFYDLSVRELISTGFDQLILLSKPLSKNQLTKVDQAIAEFDLMAIESRLFSTLSYGQREICLIVRALINNPKLLILDEMFNGLDAHHRQVLYPKLASYIQNGGTLVFSTHDSDDALIQLVSHEFCLDADTAKITNDELNNDILDRGIEESTSANINEVDSFNHSTLLVDVDNVSVYDNDFALLKDINWRIHQQQHWLISGDNGSGKSSLLRLLNGELIPAKSGRVTFYNALKQPGLWERRRFIGYVSPELQQSYRYNLTVSDVIASGFYSSIGLYKDINEDQLAEIQKQLHFFELMTLKDRPIKELSSGQFRRVLLARAMVCQPVLLLLDEIFANLDANHRATFFQLLHKIAATKTTIILTSHYHYEPISSLFKNNIILTKGSIINSLD